MNRNAYIGQNIETLFKNSIGDHPLAIQAIQEKFKIDGVFLNAIKTGIHGEKVDVKLGFACGHNIDANIKAFKEESGFNQLTRTSVSHFCDIFKITDKEQDLENIIVAKSKYVNQPLFNTQDQNVWRPFFIKNKLDILKWCMSTTPSREILVLFNRTESKMLIYAMKDAINLLNGELVFTKGGFNIGECVSFQRKGGNGSLSRNIPKTSIKHPGNNVQLKLRTSKFVEIAEQIKLYDYKI